MATLDISIINSALPQIQGEIGATGTEGTWIATGYLVAEIVMIPLPAWLDARVRPAQVPADGDAALFIALLDACAASSTSLPMMIVGRIGQGFTGGAMIPTAQTIIAHAPAAAPAAGRHDACSALIAMLGPCSGRWSAAG